MRILHTGDWHLGKYLEGNSRLKEQEKFLKDFIDIVEENNIDIVMIAGDIYDNSNPPAEAEKLFYKTMKRLTCDGERVVLVISGNHDNPERLGAANPLAFEQGIIIVDKPKSLISLGQCGKYEVLESGEGYFKIKIRDEEAVIITLPYPSEKRLNEVLSIGMEDDEALDGYSDRITRFFNERENKFKDETINIAIAHLFVIGGEESGSERPIQLGGSLAVRANSFPKKAQYVALGHLHGMQHINGGTHINYSGSPLQYSKSEVRQSKGCYIVDLKAGCEAKVEKVLFKNYKPIDIWRCKSVEAAIVICEKNQDRDSWVYLEIETDRVIEQEEIKLMKKYKKDIIEIKPIVQGSDDDENDEFIVKEQAIQNTFKDFFKNKNNVEPTEKLMDMFMEIVYGEEALEDETKITEN